MRKPEQKLKSFFDSLDEEQEYFGLSLAQVSRYTLLVTEEIEGNVVGIAGLLGNLLFLVVKSDYQNKGIGQKLTKKVIQKAIEKGYNYIRLYVYESNTKAVHLYQKLGFKKVRAGTSVRGRKTLFMVLLLNWRGMIPLLKHKLLSFYLVSTIVSKAVKAIKTVIGMPKNSHLQLRRSKKWE